ncbi:hypothetical protein ACQBBV_014475 [Enterococcus faecium]
MTTDTNCSKNKKFSKEYGLNAQLVQRHFMMDRLILNKFLNQSTKMTSF